MSPSNPPYHRLMRKERHDVRVSLNTGSRGLRIEFRSSSMLFICLDVADICTYDTMPASATEICLGRQSIRVLRTKIISMFALFAALGQFSLLLSSGFLHVWRSVMPFFPNGMDRVIHGLFSIYHQGHFLASFVVFRIHGPYRCLICR